MFTNKKSSTTSIFEVKKKHSWRNTFIKILEVGLISIVIMGTIFWFLKQSDFSLNKFVTSVVSKMKPEVNVKKVVEQKSQKETLKQIIENEKVFDIESINEVQDGFEVRAKNSLIVIFSKEKDFSSQVRTLQTLLAKAKIDNKSVKRADFRFQKIIVQY